MGSRGKGQRVLLLIKLLLILGYVFAYRTENFTYQMVYSPINKNTVEVLIYGHSGSRIACITGACAVHERQERECAWGPKKYGRPQFVSARALTLHAHASLKHLLCRLEAEKLSPAGNNSRKRRVQMGLCQGSCKYNYLLMSVSSQNYDCITFQSSQNMKMLKDSYPQIATQFHSWSTFATFSRSEGRFMEATLCRNGRYKEKQKLLVYLSKEKKSTL